MSRLPLRTIPAAPAEAQAALTAAEKANGFLPNLLRVLANAPVALETYLTVSSINARSGLALAEREAVQITAAATHGCCFCVAGHTVIATKKAGLDDGTVQALRGLRPAEDVRLAIGILWIVLVPCEMLGVSAGLGYAVLDTRDRLAYDELVAIVLLIGLIGFTLDAMARGLCRLRTHGASAAG